MKVTIQKTLDVESPTRAHATDAGLDLYVPEGRPCLIRSGATYTIDLGIRVAIPDGYYGQLTLRSSAAKQGLAIPNGVGIIDSDYRDNLELIVATLAEPVEVAAGDQICRLTIRPLLPVEYEGGVVDDDADHDQEESGSADTGPAIRDYAIQEAGTLTVGRLVKQLQDVASLYGSDTSVAVVAGGGIGLERADGLLMVNAVKTGRTSDRDQYRTDVTGTPMAVIS